MHALLAAFLLSALGTTSVMIERTFLERLSVGIGGGIVFNAAGCTECRALAPSPNLGFNVPLRVAYNFGNSAASPRRHRFYLALDGGLGFLLVGARLTLPTLVPGFYAGLGLGYAMM